MEPLNSPRARIPGKATLITAIAVAITIIVINAALLIILF